MRKFFIFLLIITKTSYSQNIKIFINNNHYSQNKSEKILIRPNENQLSVQIFSPLKDLKIRLENFQNNWIHFEGNSSFYYNKLPSGNFILEIKNKEKIISKIPIIVEAAFWEKWTFLIPLYAFLTLVVGMIIYIFLLYKFRQQAKLQKVRNNIAADLHDDVGATLTSIGFFGELIRQKIINRSEPAEILPLLSKVIDSSKESVETMRGVVWTINPNNDFAKDFFERLKYYANEMLATKSVALDFEIEGIEQQELGIEVQRNLFLFFKEAINNVLKHAQAQTATVNIKMENRKFWMKISDDGVGFDLNENFEGHGLGSLRKRIENLNGDFEIKSEVNVGTTLEVSIFLP